MNATSDQTGAHTTPRSPRPNPISQRLPSLGRRGGGWVGLQVFFLCVALLTGLLGMRWPGPARPWLAALGAAALLTGLGLIRSGANGLDRQLTPYPRPVSGGTLRRDGVYARVRHPMYGGALVALLGWALLSSPLALVALGLSAGFLDVKSRREETWLIQQHPDYTTYRQQVPHRFLPRLW